MRVPPPTTDELFVGQTILAQEVQLSGHLSILHILSLTQMIFLGNLEFFSSSAFLVSIFQVLNFLIVSLFLSSIFSVSIFSSPQFSHGLSFLVLNFLFASIFCQPQFSGPQFSFSSVFWSPSLSHSQWVSLS